VLDVEVLTIDTVRTRFPWSGEMRALGEPVELLWHYDLDVPLDTLWSMLVDTSRLNRALRLPEMRFAQREGRLHGKSMYGGRRHEWVEEPWDWVAQSYVLSTRTYSRGYGHQARALYHLRALPGGVVRLSFYFGWIPRGPVSRLLIGVGLKRLRADFDRLIPQLVAELDQARSALLVAPVTPLADDAEQRLATARTNLLARGLPAGPVDELMDFVRHGDDADLVRIQVRGLAVERGLPERELLRTCLHATRLGVLTMSWDVICPHCRGVVEEARTLGDLPRLGACHVCQIDFATDKLNAVEITFHVHPSIREVPQRFFCSAEAATKSHVEVQQRLAPGGKVALSSLLGPGRYRMRLHGSKSYRFLEVQGAPAASPADQDADRGEEAARGFVWRASEASDGTTRSQPVLELINDTGEEHFFLLERVDWSEVALRPSQIFTLQEFRDLFSEEYLSSDVQLAVGEQTLLFTDIVGSTRFYARCGDPDAFMAVKKHFEIIFEIIGKHRGAVVKTIGDAAMGAFERPLDALHAAREIQAYFAPEQRETPIRLRISLNAGPCIAVKLNSNIDYFGSTVNLAAKLQACAGPGDIAMSPTVVDAAGVLDYLREEDAMVKQVVFHIEALDKNLAVLVWRMFPAHSAVHELEAGSGSDAGQITA
jgi:class 3 adenylate cyclase